MDKNSRATKTVFTFGYRGTTVQRMINAMKENGITEIFDIRRYNQNPKSHFRKENLKAKSEECGIQYIEVKSLAPSRKLIGTQIWEKTCNCENKKSCSHSHELFNLEDFRNGYLEEIETNHGISIAMELISKAKRPCFLCEEVFDRLNECPRKILMDQLIGRSPDLNVVHVDEWQYTLGEAHDLKERFHPLNETHFRRHLSLDKLTLTWGRMRYPRLGFFRPPNRIHISTRLDIDKIPVAFLDHVVHHELCHYERYLNGKRYGHVYDFYMEEHRFEEYAKAFPFWFEIRKALGLSDRK